MTPDFPQRLASLGGYVLLIGGLTGLLLALGQGVASHAVALLPEIAAANTVGPSRVKEYERAEAAAREAPGVPVARVLVAYRAPDMPVQALAIHLDDAESMPAKRPHAKLKKSARLAKADVRRKTHRAPGGDLPDLAVRAEAGPGGMAARLESARDITNRSLGVLVALAP